MSDWPHPANDGLAPDGWQPVQSCIRPRAPHPRAARSRTILPPSLLEVRALCETSADDAFAGYTSAQRARALRAELERWQHECVAAPHSVVERHPELVPAAARLAIVR